MITINLWAKEGYLSTPDGGSIYFWGFSTAADSPAQLPGPHMIIKQNEAVTVNLTNTLPEPVSISFPGQSSVTSGGKPVQPQYEFGGRLLSFTNHALPGDVVEYTFIPRNPGTYIYESGTYPYKQCPMGLHGAVVVRPRDYDPTLPEYKTAYGFGTDTEFEREYLLITGEINPDLHRSLEEGKPYPVNQCKARYWTLNGRCAPDTMLPDHVSHMPHQPYGAMIMAQPKERVLLRYLGAGLGSHPLHPHGVHTRVVGLDGNLLRNGTTDRSFKRFTVLVRPGQTYDQIYQWFGLGYTSENPIPTVVPNLRNLAVGDVGFTMWSGSPYLGVKGDIPVGVVSFNELGEYHFMLHSHQEMEITNWGEFPGGMMTMVAIYPSLSPEMGVLE